MNDPPVASASVTCDQLACTFDGTASTDPEGGALTYDWDFGDGSGHGSGATTTHTYGSAGDRAVTLKVTDNKSATNAVTKTASPIDAPDPISFVASSNTNGSRSNHTVTIPASVKAGDTLLMFFSANSVSPVYAAPSDWTQVLSENGTSEAGRVYTKTASATDAGKTVTVTSKSAADGTAATVKDDLTLAAYRGTGLQPITASASTSQNVADTVHQTPTVNAPDGTNWLVSYWTDKGSTTTGWTGPAGQTQRAEGTATGTSHVSSLLMDSNHRVNTGVQGGLNATADPSSSAQGITMSLLLSAAGPAPANQPPVAHAALTGCTQLTCNFDGASSSDPEGGTLTYDWDWGDNTAHGTTATPSHTYAPGTGNKTVTLKVTDPQGASSTDTVTATPT